jgi:malonyl-CoA/methylmalonyl-CoA synthetase
MAPPSYIIQYAASSFPFAKAHTLSMMLSTVRRVGLQRATARKWLLGVTYRHLLTADKLSFSDVLCNPDYANNIALIDDKHNFRLTYSQLNDAASKLADMIESNAKDPAQFTAVGSFNEPGTAFVVSMMASWKLGKIFVPLSTSHSQHELEYFVEDSKVGIICCATKTGLNQSFLQFTQLPVLETGKLLKSVAAKDPSDVPRDHFAKHLRGEDSLGGNVQGDSGALVIYTSGTTGKPKGVLHTHRSLYHMTHCLVQSWKYTAQDKILHYLPLYHVHGLVNKLLCVLYAGGTVEFTGTAAAPKLWERLALEEQHYQAHKKGVTTSTTGKNKEGDDYKPLTLFMAVPTIYARMLESANELKSHDPKALKEAVAALKRMRLMVCGSAALPDNVLKSWKQLTGYTLLERYGMTEIGMALSNPYEGERRQGEYIQFAGGL